MYCHSGLSSRGPLNCVDNINGTHIYISTDTLPGMVQQLEGMLLQQDNFISMDTYHQFQMA